MKFKDVFPDPAITDESLWSSNYGEFSKYRVVVVAREVAPKDWRAQALVEVPTWAFHPCPQCGTLVITVRIGDEKKVDCENVPSFDGVMTLANLLAEHRCEPKEEDL